MADNNETAIVKAQANPIVGSKGLILANLDEMWRYANIVHKSRMAPESLNTPEKVVCALQWGNEIGLSYMQSIKSIAVVKGVPSLWGDVALAMVRKSGLLKTYREYMEGEGDERACVTESQRTDMAEPSEPTRFSVADAKTAKLWDKSGSWSTHPTRMMKYKSRAFHLRDNFSDVLMGLHVTEEFEGERDVRLEYEPEAKATVAPRAERTGDDAIDVQVEDDLDVVLAEKFTDLVRNGNPHLTTTISDIREGTGTQKPAILDSLYDQFVSYVLGCSIDDAAKKTGDCELATDEIAKCNEALKNGLPQAIIDLIPKPVPDAEATDKPVAVGETEKTDIQNDDLFKGDK